MEQSFEKVRGLDNTKQIRGVIRADALDEEFYFEALGRPVNYLMGEELEIIGGEEFKIIAFRHEDMIGSITGTLDRLLVNWLFQEFFDPNSWSESDKEMIVLSSALQ